MLKKYINFIVTISVLFSIIGSIEIYKNFIYDHHPIKYDNLWLIGFIAIIAAQLIFLFFSIIRQIHKLLNKEKSLYKLEYKLIIKFIGLSIIPTIIVAVFSIIFSNYGVLKWNYDKIKNILYQSNLVAEAYYIEHTINIRNELINMAYDLEKFDYLNSEEQLKFKNIFKKYYENNDKDYKIIFDYNKNIILTNNNNDLLDKLLVNIDNLTFKNTALGKVVIIPSMDNSRISAIISIKNQKKALYLLISNTINSKVVKYMEDINNTSLSYNKILEYITNKQNQFYSLFLVIIITFIMYSIWIGNKIIIKIIAPISNLIFVSNKIVDYSLQNKNKKSDHNNIDALSSECNNILYDLKWQRKQLYVFNNSLKENQILINAILASIPTGIMIIDGEEKAIKIINNNAKILLSLSDECIDQNIYKIIPEFTDILNDIIDNKYTILSEKISIKREKIYHLLIKIKSIAMNIDDLKYSYCITIDSTTLY